MQPMSVAAALMTASSLIHAVTAILSNQRLKEMHMNLSDRLHQIAHGITAGAPHLATVMAEVESTVAALAPAVAAALPNTGAANVANELSQAATAAQEVTGAVVGVLTSAPIAPTPIASVPTPAPQSVQEAATDASLAAASVSATATATPGSLESRLAIMESAFVELLPAVASVLRAFGR